MYFTSLIIHLIISSPLRPLKLTLFLSPPENMILLGSVDRTELLALCDWWLSAERRIMMQHQGLQQQESCVRASWESFAFVDEEADDSGDKVSPTLDTTEEY